MNYHFDEKEIERQVWDFMRRFASEPINEHSLLLDGKIHRFRVEGDKQSEKSGSYCIYISNQVQYRPFYLIQAIYYTYQTCRKTIDGLCCGTLIYVLHRL